MNDAQLKELESDIAHLKFAYEQYFMGLERLAPLDEFEAVSKKVRAATVEQISNTALRFQRNNLVAKFNSYLGYWNRIMRQIEEGTYKRDRLRAAKITASTNKPQAPQAAQAPKAQETQNAQSSQAIAPPATSPAAQAGRPLEYIYNEYKNALAGMGQNTNLSYEALAGALTKQQTLLKSKYACRDVKFRVAVENGKVQIKAVPIK